MLRKLRFDPDVFPVKHGVEIFPDRVLMVQDVLRQCGVDPEVVGKVPLGCLCVCVFYFCIVVVAVSSIRD